MGNLVWCNFEKQILSKLTDSDDPSLWQAALDELFGDAQYLCKNSLSKSAIFARIGRCSHWMSPHNKGSLLKDGRYAWATGYGKNGSVVHGLPEFDWSLIWQWCKQQETWMSVGQIRGKRPFLFRVAVPARTAKHPRAVVHALWTPGAPTAPKEKFPQAYGFMTIDGVWQCTCTSTSKSGKEDEPYEVF